MMLPTPLGRKNAHILEEHVLLRLLFFIPVARKDVYDFKGFLRKCRNLGMGDGGGAVVVPDRSGRVFGDVDGFMMYLLEFKARS